MKTNGRAYRVAVLIVALLAACSLSSAWAAPGPATTLHVNAVVQPTGVRIEVQASGAFEFTTYRPSENLFIADLVGVTAEGPQNARVLTSEVVSSYRVIQYRAGDRPVVRLEVLLRAPVEPRVDRQGTGDLTFAFESSAPAAAAAPSAKGTPRAVETSLATKTAIHAKPIRPVHKLDAEASIAPKAKSIERLSLDAQGQQVRVRMEGDGRLAYDVTRLSNPDRLVFDFSGAQLRLAKHNLAGSLEPVRGVRAAQFKPDLARVVIDLAHSTPYSVNAAGNALTVTFGAPARPASAEPAVAVSTADNNVTTPTATTGAAPVAEAPAASEPAKPLVEESKASEIAPAATSETQPANPVAPAETVPATGISMPETPAQPAATLARPVLAKVEPTVPATAEPKPETSIPATPAPVAPVRPSASMQGAAADAKPAAGGKYTGEPVSVNLKDVDLKDFFRLIHEISGLNVVLDPAVKGSLTIVLDDVPWDQALDIVLQNNGLDKQLDGNVLRIATNDTVKKEAETKRDLVKAQAEAVAQITATRVLSYAKATSIRDTLKRFLSARGDILADDRSNTLIIRDIPSVLPDIDSLIKQLDRKSQQVEIEARVVSASRSFSREIGTQFGIAGAINAGRNIFGGLPGNAAFVSPLIRGIGLPPPPLVSSGSSAMPLNTNLGATTPTSGVSYAFSSKNFALDFLISAAEAKGVGKLLSKPKVITQNNEKATVKQGSKIPVQTVINNTISTQFIDAVLKLEVTPQITADGTVYMEVMVENTAIDNGTPRVQGIPALTTQSAETKVLVNDGGTVVIGGVIISNQRTDITQVPLLGSIPVIGHLFKHSTVSTDSKELLFFLTPRIVPT
ncbi:MAG TPA: type IV pilus secretin PilQ [Candidatus Acidoferrum sp.]|nr:type IV pilus secretin PilQ [Candidatus Acidoferrum sp.]